MCRDVTRASWVSILKPSATYILVPFVDDEVNVGQVPLVLVCCGNTSDTSTNANETDLARGMNRTRRHLVPLLHILVGHDFVFRGWIW